MYAHSSRHDVEQDEHQNQRLDHDDEIEADCEHHEDQSYDLRDVLTVTLTYHKEAITLTLPATATISDLSDQIATDFSVPTTAQKLLFAPKPGLLRPPFKEPEQALSTLLSLKPKITLLGSTTSAITDLNSTLSTVRARTAARAAALRSAPKASTYRDPRRAADEAKYTFHRVAALPFLRDPAKSQRFLERLAADAGIKAAMRKHKFSVGLLTEMDPAAHTTHESRTLGLNRNAGEVIELRLRTDDYEGYRDYKVIRKTLCHELAHNVHGPHERPFWDLMAEIEKEVKENDWRSGGRSVGADEFSRPGDFVRDDEVDGGGWTGGSYVLGVGEGKAAGETVGLSRREIVARAAEERARKVKESERKGKAEEGGKDDAAGGS